MKEESMLSLGENTLVNSFFVIELLSFSYNLNFIVRRDLSDLFLVQPFIIHAKMLGQRNRNLPS